MTERKLCDDKWVRIMADYTAEGVWAKDGACESIDELPVSKDLRDRIMAWQHRYDRECQDYLPIQERTIDFDFKDFSKAGHALALEVKSALPDWTVIYHDEERAGHEPPLDCEYESHFHGDQGKETTDR
jgi:hypothetical protein